MRRRRATGAALAATAAIVVGTFGVASATTPPDSGAAAGSAPAAADPCASTTATTEPAATEAPATTAAAGTRSAGRDGCADHRAGPRRHRGPRTYRGPRDGAAGRHRARLRRRPSTSTRSHATRCSRAASSAWRCRRSPTTGTPYNPLGNDLDYATILQPMSYHVWNFAADGTATLDPNYVLSSSTSEGTPGQPFTVTYTLNPDANWNNGDPIDVDDYVAYWQALNGIDHPDFPVVATDGLRPDHVGRGRAPTSSRSSSRSTTCTPTTSSCST